MPDMHSLPEGSRPTHCVRNNGPDNLALERWKLRELAEGWPMYRDHCEWENLESLFYEDDAYIYTTWTGRTFYKDFIKASKAGMDKGAWIMHRCFGATTDITPDATRAVTKLKAIITQRFDLDGGEVDVESDCRFCFFFVKDGKGEWKAKYVRHWYEKDKMMPINPNKVPKLDEKKLETYPVGYRYLAYCQELTMGVKVKMDMPGHRREAAFGTDCGKAHDELYKQVKRWLDGEDFEI